MHACNEPIKVFKEIRANHIAGFSKKFGGRCVSWICIGYNDEDQTIFRICRTTIKVSDKSVWIIDYNPKKSLVMLRSDGLGFGRAINLLHRGVLPRDVTRLAPCYHLITVVVQFRLNSQGDFNTTVHLWDRISSSPNHNQPNINLYYQTLLT